MMDPTDLPLVLAALKRALKARGLTYRDLAAQMGLPESTLKKMMSAKDLSFRRLEAICRALELDMTDVLGSLTGRGVRTVTFTPAQEAFFEEDPAAFAVFWRLVIERATPAAIAAARGLSKSALFRYLRRLDGMGLIELHAGDVVRLPKIQPIRWNVQSPFVQDLIRRWAGRVTDDLLGPEPQGSLAVQYFQLRRDSYEQLLASLRELESEFAKRTARDLSLGQELVRVRAVFAVAEGSYVPEDSPAKTLR